MIYGGHGDFFNIQNLQEMELEANPHLTVDLSQKSFQAFNGVRLG